MIQIKHRFSGATLCEFDVATLKEAVVKAVSAGANLAGAYLGEKFGKLKDKGIFRAGPLGSQEDFMDAYHTDKGVFIKAGCFFDSLELFRAAVIKSHGEESKHGKLYLGMANVIEFKFSENGPC